MKMNAFSSRILWAVSVFVFASLPVCALSLDDVMNAALGADSSLADAYSRLRIAENNRFKSASLYGTNLSVSGSVKGSAAEPEPEPAPLSLKNTQTANQVEKTVTASLSVPIAKWLTLSAQASGTETVTSGSISLSVTPFAKPDTQAEFSWNKAVIDAQAAVRATLLSVRKEYRAVQTALADKDLKRASVATAQNELTRIRYLVELGTERKSQEISAYSKLLDAQVALDSSTHALALALQALSSRTALELDEGTPFDDLEVSERSLVDENTWVSKSSEIALASINLESVRIARRQSVSLPDLSLGTTLSDTLDWSVTAKVSLTPEVVFQKNTRTAADNLAIQERSFSAAERSVRTAWTNLMASLSAAEQNVRNAERLIESAELSYSETVILKERGEAAQAALDEAAENVLSAKYQFMRARESLENVRDQLDPAWQLAF